MAADQTDLHEPFLRLFTANEPAIRAYVRRLVPTRHDAADVMQELSLVLWRKFADLDDRQGFRKWPFTVAHYEVLAWMRDKARDRHVLAADVLALIAEESANKETKLAAQREALESCLQKLSSEHRTLVLAAYESDAKIQNVAKRSNRTVGGFYQWLHRIRLRLIECTQRILRAEGMV